MKLSVIIPTFRRPKTLRAVLTSFLNVHRVCNRQAAFEVIVIESEAVPETAAVAADVRTAFADLRLDLVHATTDRFGYVGKVAEGFARVSGTHVLVLSDEDFSQYDFLSPILRDLDDRAVYAIPFSGSLIVRRIYAGGYPSYFRHGVPAFPHAVCSRETFGRFIADIADYVHYVTDHHVPLLCWELGLPVVFVSEFLRIPPLLHVEAADFGDAPDRTYDMRAISRGDRRTFLARWPLERKRAAVRRMIDVLHVMSARSARYRLVRCRDEVFLTLPESSADEPISTYYTWLTPPLPEALVQALLAEEALATPRWNFDDAAPPQLTLLARAWRRLAG